MVVMMLKSIKRLTFHSIPYHLAGNKRQIYEDIDRRAIRHEFQLHRNYHTKLPIKP